MFVCGVDSVGQWAGRCGLDRSKVLILRCIARLNKPSPNLGHARSPSSHFNETFFCNKWISRSFVWLWSIKDCCSSAFYNTFCSWRHCIQLVYLAVAGWMCRSEDVLYFSFHRANVAGKTIWPAGKSAAFGWTRSRDALLPYSGNGFATPIWQLFQRTVLWRSTTNHH